MEFFNAIKKILHSNDLPPDPRYDDDYLEWNNYGARLSVKGKKEEALQAYDRAITIAAVKGICFSTGLKNKANVLGSLGRYEEALELYDKYIKVDPTQADVFYLKGITLRNLGRNIEAKKVFDEVRKIDPSYPFE